MESASSSLVWKYLEIVMSKRLSKLEFHDCLRCSIGDRGTCTATTEVELTQQLTYLEQVPLYGVCVDLKKTYDSMDRDR